MHFFWDDISDELPPLRPEVGPLLGLDFSDVGSCNMIETKHSLILSSNIELKTRISIKFLSEIGGYKSPAMPWLPSQLYLYDVM